MYMYVCELLTFCLSPLILYVSFSPVLIVVSNILHYITLCNINNIIMYNISYYFSRYKFVFVVLVLVNVVGGKTVLDIQLLTLEKLMHIEAESCVHFSKFIIYVDHPD